MLAIACTRSVCLCSLNRVHLSGIDTKTDCTVQLKSPSLGNRPDEGLFAVLDGGRSTDAPVAVRKTLESTMLEEMVDEERTRKRGSIVNEKLQYLVHTFLSAHRYENKITVELLSQTAKSVLISKVTTFQG